MLRRICLGLALTLLVGCSDDPSGPDLEPDPQPSVSAALVSAPVAPATAAGEASRVRSGGARVFVAMPPGTEAGGISVTIRVKRTDASVTTVMVDGGFDPVAIEAVAGDSLAITVTRPSGTEVGYSRVPATSTPVVVRTSPRHRRVDVPLNQVIIVVFNEPMDPATLIPAIRLRDGAVEIAGTVTAVLLGGDVLGAQFAPEGLLEAGTTFTLEVSTAARNKDGTPLDSPVRTEFTTGTAVADATLVVSTTTTGSDVDPNGYDVVLDGAPAHPIDASGTLSIPVASGAHSVALSGVTDNCTVIDPTRELIVEAGATVTVGFSVACSTVATSGELRLTTATAGADLDLDGYQISVDGAPSRAIGLNAAFLWMDLAGGAHAVSLSELSRNCRVEGGLTRSANVIRGTTVDVDFEITCTPVGTGTLVVKTSTSGPDQDPDGYSMSIDHGPRQPIPANGTIEMVLPDTSTYMVRLSGVRGNCSLSGDEWREVQPAAGRLTVVTFEVECLEDVRPSGAIAFTTSDGSTWSIFTSQADGRGRVRIASGTGQIGPLAWSPDGERLAFSIWTPGGNDIFVVNADGSNLVQRTDTGENVSPTWSPDGHHVAFARLPDDVSHWGVYVMNVDENWNDLSQIGPLFTYNPLPAWSPDGTRFAFIDEPGRRVALMRSDGSGVDHLQSVEGSYGSLGRPAWSPDGAAVAVPAWYQDNWSAVDVSYVLLMRTDGSEVRAPAWSPGGMGSVAWSPEGSIIAYQSYCDSPDPCIGFVTPEGRVSSVVILDAQNAVWRP